MVMKPCIKCGATDRYKSGRCRPCSISSASRWRLENPLKVKSMSAAYWDKNRESIKEKNSLYRLANLDKQKKYMAEYSPAYYAANKDRLNKRGADYYLKHSIQVRDRTNLRRRANPGVVRIYEQNRSAREKLAGGRLSVGLAARLFAIQRGKCACCGLPLGDDYHLDHIMPLALGGSNTDDNIQLLRAKCNLQKHAKHPIDFMQQRGFLL